MSDKTLSKEIEIKILDNKYTTKLPKTGQIIEIETRKIRMGNGVYQDLIMGSNDAFFVRVLIDAIATFTVLIPKLKEDLTIDILELELNESRELVSAYTEQFLPWYNEWAKIFDPADKK